MFFYYWLSRQKGLCRKPLMRPRFVRTIKPVKQPVRSSVLQPSQIINQDDGVSSRELPYHSIGSQYFTALSSRIEIKCRMTFISVIANMVRNICLKSFPLAVNVPKCRYGIQMTSLVKSAFELSLVPSSSIQSERYQAVNGSVLFQLLEYRKAIRFAPISVSIISSWYKCAQECFKLMIRVGNKLFCFS